MSTASLELSKQLYELSRLDGLYKDGVSDNTRNLQRKVDGLFPLYDLGYLIRKLPRCTNIYLGTYEKAWAVYTALNEYAVEADTPEDAACKLCIELFKQNILTKETK